MIAASSWLRTENDDNGEPSDMHDWLNQLHRNQPAFPIVEISIKVGIALAIGMLVGIEREWSQKDLGVRTFTLSTLLGTLASLVSAQALIAGSGAVLLLIAFVNLRALQVSRKLEATTSMALMLVFILGLLVGNGHVFTPVACALIVTMLLSLKPQLRTFAGGLQPEEIRSALLLGLFGFVIWPLLPDRFIDPWSLIEPREAWVTVIVVASLGFVNYVLLRVFGSKSVYSTALLGGLVNSTATVAELCSSLPKAGLENKVVAAVLISSVAMFLRNLIILCLFARTTVARTALPLLAMTGMAILWIYRESMRSRSSKIAAADQIEDNDQRSAKLITLTSPVSFVRVLKFASLFLAIQLAGTLAQRYLGNSGLQIVSLIGGLVSSASTTTAAANLAHHGSATIEQVSLAVVLTSIASAAVDLPLIKRQIKSAAIFRSLLFATAMQACVGIVAILMESAAWRHF